MDSSHQRIALPRNISVNLNTVFAGHPEEICLKNIIECVLIRISKYAKDLWTR